MTGSLIDNDIISKSIVYGFSDEMVLRAPIETDRYIVLGTARYALPKKIRRKKPKRGAHRAVEDFYRFLAQVEEAEPTDEELALAAEIEKAAQDKGLAVDQGESLLAALLVVRGGDYLLTGDKRAIRAFETLADDDDRLRLLGRVVCLEQLAIAVVRRLGIDDLRAAVCDHEAIDRALTNCFACHTDGVDPEECERGLDSYIADLKKEAPRCLAPSLSS